VNNTLPHFRLVSQGLKRNKTKKKGEKTKTDEPNPVGKFTHRKNGPVEEGGDQDAAAKDEGAEGADSNLPPLILPGHLHAADSVGEEGSGIELEE